MDGSDADLSFIDDALRGEDKLTYGEGEHHLDSGEYVEITRAVKVYTLCASLHSVIVGYDQGVSTHISMLVQKEFGLSDWERGLYLAILFLFMMVGAVGSPFISDRVGRRAAMACSSYVFLAGTVMMILTGSFYGLLIGRAICGFGAGLGFMVDAMYIAEVSPATHRGELVTWSYMALTMGLMLGISAGFLFGSLDDETRWRTMLGIGMVFPIALIVACIKVLVASPRFLILAKRSKEARYVLSEIYPKGYCVNAVLEDIRHALQRDKLSQNDPNVGWSTLRHPSPAFRRMLYLGWGISLIQEAVGASAIHYFILDFMESSKVQPGVMETIALIGLIIIKLQCIIICSQLVDMPVFGRTLLLLFSLAGMTVSLLAMGVSFYMNGSVEPVMAMLALCAYLSFYGIGLGPVSRLIPVEIFPTCIRAKALCVAVVISRGTAAVLSLTLLSLKDAVSWPEVFFGLSGLCLVTGVILFCYLPETKNMSLEEFPLLFSEITHDVELQATERKLRGAELVQGFDGGGYNTRRKFLSSATRMIRV